MASDTASPAPLSRGAEPPALNPRREFTDPAAAVVWAAICALSDGAQHEVARQLAERLSVLERDRPGHEFRRARAVAALREAAALLGHSPTVSEYRELRETHPEYGWPPDGSVRRLLSESASWNGALGEARLDAIPDPQPSGPGNGPDMTAAEIRQAVEDCARELGQQVAELSYSSYLLWARQPAVRRRPGRRPRSTFPFNRYGGWPAVTSCIAAGEPLDGEGAENGPPRRRAIVRSNGTGYGYTDEQIFAAADEIIARLGRGQTWPTTTEWIQGRRALLEERRELGLPPQAFPGRNVVWEHFGSWPNARRAYERARESNS